MNLAERVGLVARDSGVSPVVLIGRPETVTDTLPALTLAAVSELPPHLQATALSVSSREALFDGYGF